MACDCRPRSPADVAAGLREAAELCRVCEPQSDEAIPDFLWDKHTSFFLKHLETLPAVYSSLSTNRLAAVYFCLSALDFLGRLDEVDKERVKNYIYFYMSPHADRGGFYGFPPVQFESEELDRANNQPHIANTYVALVMLLILGDDLSRIDRDAVASSLRRWQLPNGSFCCVHGISSLDSESDIRFVYCAAVICYVLDLWDAIDLEKMFEFIVQARGYDGAFGMDSGCESHGGCTYCAVAALAMMGRLDRLPNKLSLIDWCIKRQHFGFQGRIEKDMDTCYSFWVGASLDLLGAGSLIQSKCCARYIKKCESHIFGGFLKSLDCPMPDILHSYYSVVGLSLSGVLDQRLDARLGITKRAAEAAPTHLCKLPVDARKQEQNPEICPPESAKLELEANTG